MLEGSVGGSGSLRVEFFKGLDLRVEELFRVLISEGGAVLQGSGDLRVEEL